MLANSLKLATYPNTITRLHAESDFSLKVSSASYFGDSLPFSLANLSRLVCSCVYMHSMAVLSVFYQKRSDERAKNANGLRAIAAGTVPAASRPMVPCDCFLFHRLTGLGDCDAKHSASSEHAF